MTTNKEQLESIQKEAQERLERLKKLLAEAVQLKLITQVDAENRLLGHENSHITPLLKKQYLVTDAVLIEARRLEAQSKSAFDAVLRILNKDISQKINENGSNLSDVFALKNTLYIFFTEPSNKTAAKVADQATLKNKNVHLNNHLRVIFMQTRDCRANKTAIETLFTSKKVIAKLLRPGITAEEEMSIIEKFTRLQHYTIGEPEGRYLNPYEYTNILHFGTSRTAKLNAVIEVSDAIVLGEAVNTATPALQSGRLRAAII